MDIPVCIAEASSAYQIAQSAIVAAIEKGLPAGVVKDDRVGPMAIPLAWLPVFESMGISSEAVVNNVCQNILAGTWVLAFQQQERQVSSKVQSIGKGLGSGKPLSKAVNERRKKWSYAVYRAAAQTGEPAALIDAVITVESGYQHQVVSKAKAIGLMQLMPGTASMLGVNPWDGEQNILGGAKYLARLRRQFGGNLHLMLAAYNAGPAAVTRNGYRIPPFAETKAYVPKVLMHLQHSGLFNKENL